MSQVNYIVHTERRLKTYPQASEALEVEREKLEEYRQGKRRKNSRIRQQLSKSGYRVDCDTMLEALIKDTLAEIAKQEEQKEQLEKALQAVSSDPQYEVIERYFFNQQAMGEIAEQMHYSPATIRNAKNRLVHRIAIRLYGLKALQEPFATATRPVLCPGYRTS